MKRIAAIANAGASHLMAMCAIGRELQRRGHHFVLFGTPYQRAQLRVSDIPFQVVGANAPDPAQTYNQRGREAGSVSFSDAIRYMTGMANLLCTELPALLARSGIDLVLADQEEPGAATAADLSGVPYVSICNSLPLNEAADLPPAFLPWSYSTGIFAQLRNRLGYAIRNLFIASANRVLNFHRRSKNLKPYRRPDDSFSKRAQITQLIREFDLPRRTPIPAFHYVGPFQREPLFPVEFPFERLDGRPMIYASLGTSLGSRTGELEAIAAACAGLPVQLVIALGGLNPDSRHTDLPGRPIVVSYAPQLELLRRSALAVTHAGLNTTMEALGLGVPLIALPVAGDQFGVAARIEWHRLGRSLSASNRRPEQLKAAIIAQLKDSESQAACRRMQDRIRQTGGAAEAAAIIETVLP